MELKIKPDWAIASSGPGSVITDGGTSPVRRRRTMTTQQQSRTAFPRFAIGDGNVRWWHNLRAHAVSIGHAITGGNTSW